MPGSNASPGQQVAAVEKEANLGVGQRFSGLRQLLGSLAPNSLRARLAIALVIAVAVPLGASGYIFSTRAADEAIQAAQTEQETLATALAGYMDNYLDLHAGAITALAAEIQGDRAEGDAIRQIERDMADLRMALPEFSLLSAQSATGAHIAASSTQPIAPITGNPGPTSTNPIAFGTTNVRVSDLVRATNRPAILVVIFPIDSLPGLAVGVPLKTSSGENDGSLIGVIFPEKVSALLAQASSIPGLSAYVLDDRGTIVAESDRRVHLDVAQNGLASALNELNGEDQPVGSVRHAAQHGIEIVSRAPIGNRDWSLIIKRSEADVLRGAESRRETATVILVLAILGAIATALLGAKWLSDPLATLARATDRLGEGDASVPLPDSNLSEIAGLTLAFENLRARLQARSAEVAEANTQLEARVASRTDELRRSALQLQQELEQRIRMEAAIRSLGRERALILDTVTQGICEVGPDRHVTFANPAAADLLGYTSANLVGKEFHSLVHPDAEPDDCELARALRESSAVHLSEAWFTRADGVRLPVECDCTPLIEEGSARGVLLTFSDATARLESQRQREALAQWEKLRALGQMASGVAHDLNQKLALIVGHSELAQRALIEGDDGIADSLRIMGQAA
ncbi:MAG TPA: PAS domain S-box protein, partial [Chloroflexota bacterium]